MPARVTTMVATSSASVTRFTSCRAARRAVVVSRSDFALIATELDAPLDELLGQTSHVRILRALTEYEHPVPPVELARVTRLDLSGLRRAIDRLATLGIVRSLGVGRGRVVAFNADHRFAAVLRALFEAERRQRQTLIASLQQVLE